MVDARPCPNCGELHPEVKPIKYGGFNVLVCPKVTQGEIVIVDASGKRSVPLGEK